MSLNGLLLTLLAALITAASNLLLRSGITRGGGFGVSGHGLFLDLLVLSREPRFSAGVVLYGAAALVWFRVVSTEALSNSYILLVSVTFILVTSGAMVFFGEPLTVRKAAGTILVLIGLSLIARNG